MIKKILLVYLVILPVCAAQTYINLHKTDGTVITVDISEIDSISFSLEKQGGLPCPGIPLIEFEGKTYNTVQIGSQCWLKENLDIGIMIPGVEEPADNGIVEKYCYRNNQSNCEIYGGLYKWDELMQYSTEEGSRGICPPDWHIPTQNDFEKLSEFVNHINNNLKSIGQGTGIGEGNNSSGFSALLGGGRFSGGGFNYLNEYGAFWSSTGGYEEFRYTMRLPAASSIVLIGYSGHNAGFSVRCIKN